MMLSMKLPAGNIIPLEADGSDLIQSAKFKLEGILSTPSHKFVVRLGDLTLLAKHTVDHYDIVDGQLLNVAVWIELQITVRKKVWIELEQEGSTVQGVKRKLWTAERIPIQSQTLSFFGEAMQDGDLLAEHGVHDLAALAVDVAEGESVDW
jgi:hypothetical protein